MPLATTDPAKLPDHQLTPFSQRSELSFKSWPIRNFLARFTISSHPARSSTFRYNVMFWTFVDTLTYPRSIVFRSEEGRVHAIRLRNMHFPGCWFGVALCSCAVVFWRCPPILLFMRTAWSLDYLIYEEKDGEQIHVCWAAKEGNLRPYLSPGGIV